MGSLRRGAARNIIPPGGKGLSSQDATRGIALIAQSAERILGKDEVTGSSPVKGSIRRRSSAG
jgi:hypothetical protein